MAGDLKASSTGNLFVIFGEPDIRILPDGDGRIRVKVRGVDVFDPSTGEVRSDGADGIACWFIDTDYNEESFFVRHVLPRPERSVRCAEEGFVQIRLAAFAASQSVSVVRYRFGPRCYEVFQCSCSQ